MKNATISETDNIGFGDIDNQETKNRRRGFHLITVCLNGLEDNSYIWRQAAEEYLIYLIGLKLPIEGIHCRDGWTYQEDICPGFSRGEGAGEFTVYIDLPANKKLCKDTLWGLFEDTLWKLSPLLNGISIHRKGFNKDGHFAVQLLAIGADKERYVDYSDEAMKRDLEARQR